MKSEFQVANVEALTRVLLRLFFYAPSHFLKRKARMLIEYAARTRQSVIQNVRYSYRLRQISQAMGRLT